MFIHPALTWGFFLALVPLMIHLINLVRRRRVQWAAMEFLLQSYKKHQKWVWLQQLLLLLLRMIAMVAVVAMLAQWIARSQWFSLLGGRVTHHYILLDDSMSMSERFGGASAFDKASQSLARIATQAMAQESPQKFTVLRFSRALGFRKDDTSTAIGQLAELNGERVDARFDVLVEDLRRKFAVTQLAIRPRVALELANELLRQSRDETNIVYLLSDFRSQDWSDLEEVKQLLAAIDDASERVRFVNCAPETQQTNLAITEVRPADEIRAAGVPLAIDVRVTNFGQDTARRIPVKVRSAFYDPNAAAAEPGKLSGKVDEPPAVLIDELPAGQSTTRQIQVFFPLPGQHVVQATLPDDLVAADNVRWTVIDVHEGENVLVVDGDPGKRNAYYLGSAFQPGARASTGIVVTEKETSYLRDTSPESLAAYRAIYLLDVDRLDERAVDNLEKYVRAGGGLAIFVGEHVNYAFYTTRLYRDGQGLFPLPLDREELLPPDIDENVPDFQVIDHPLFSAFLGEQNPFIRFVTIERSLRPPLGWSPPADSAIRVIARLRSHQPLIVERQFGEGRVAAFLTTVSPEWNNWANDPSFVILLLKLQTYLAAPQRGHDARLVGTPLRLPLSAESAGKEIVFVVPGPKPDMPIVVRRTANAAVNETPPGDAVASPKDESPSRQDTVLPGISEDAVNTARGGIYEAWTPTLAGPAAVRRFAFNVDPVESNILQSRPQTLLADLAPVRIAMQRADDFAFELTEDSRINRSTWLMIFLVVVLAGEQLLAYFASYHPATAKGLVRG